VTPITAVGKHTRNRALGQLGRGEPGQHLEIGELLRDLIPFLLNVS